jgi:ketosteroid isomerase-like protein
MTPVQDAITGKEVQGDLSSAYQALVQFYCAFNTGDLQMMSENWALSEEIAMDNPLGGIRRGWDEIGPFYAHIFESPAEVYVEYYDYTIHETAEMFYTVGRERGHFRLGGEAVSLAVRTSRIFKKSDGGWRQVHHHGSIEDARLLDRYQSVVSGRTPQV